VAPVTQRTDTSAWPCSIARAVDALGDGWTLLLLREACLGVRRFDDFQQRLGIGRNILARRLQQLVEDGFFTKVAYTERPVRYEYRLTEKGRDVYPVLAAMAAWSDRWQAGPEGSPLQLHHATCGHDMHATVVCSECGEPLDVRDVRAAPGPGFRTALRRARAAGHLPPGAAGGPHLTAT
jgi:DNA-binding HxlR family transcriptional regulator